MQPGNSSDPRMWRRCDGSMVAHACPRSHLVLAQSHQSIGVRFVSPRSQHRLVRNALPILLSSKYTFMVATHSMRSVVGPSPMTTLRVVTAGPVSRAPRGRSLQRSLTRQRHLSRVSLTFVAASTLAHAQTRHSAPRASLNLLSAQRSVSATQLDPPEAAQSCKSDLRGSLDSNACPDAAQCTARLA
jgi:hypothetical protein